MPRDARAYLSDIVEACDAITAALLGEAVSALSRVTPDAFTSITRARRFAALVIRIALGRLEQGLEPSPNSP